MTASINRSGTGSVKYGLHMKSSVFHN